MSWTWRVERLDRYLENPNQAVPGATTASRVRNKKYRADIIAYLKTLRSPPGTEPVRFRSKTGFEDLPKQ